MTEIEKIKEWSERGVFEVNGKEFTISKLSHQFRVEVLAMYSQIEPLYLARNLGFLSRQDFQEIMKKIDEKILFDDSTIAKTKDFWDNHQEDYIDYVGTVLRVISFPFYKAKLGIG